MRGRKSSFRFRELILDEEKGEVPLWNGPKSGSFYNAFGERKLKITKFYILGRSDREDGLWSVKPFGPKRKGCSENLRGVQKSKAPPCPAKKNCETRMGQPLLNGTSCYPFTIFFDPPSHTAIVLLKYEKLAKWQPMAALLPKTSFSTTGLRLRTAL